MASNEQWLETCRERGRRGGLASARKRRDELNSSLFFREDAQQRLRYQRKQLVCPDCGRIMLRGICQQCNPTF